MKLPQFALRDLFWLVLVVACLCWFVSLVSSTSIARWDGAYALTIQPESQSGRQIERILYYGVPRVETAQFVFHEGWPQEGFEECKKSNGFVASLPTYGQSNALGFDVSRCEWRHLVICAEYSDGTQSMAIVEAPKGGIARTVSVLLP